VAAPRILIVDDQRDISRMLRAALETLGRGYVIVDVPSAEEAILEMRRGGVDLLVTDLRLPGISGLELIRRLQAASNQARLMVISAYGDSETRRQVKALGAAFFAKPLSLEEFLDGVQRALGDRAVPVLAAAPAVATMPLVKPADALKLRLDEFRRQISAVAVLMTSLRGRVVAQAGDPTALDLGAVIPPLAVTLEASQAVGQALGREKPPSVHFFDGRDSSLYVANIGARYALLVVYAGDRGALQAGVVMRLGRQLADALLEALPAFKTGPLSTKPAVPDQPLTTAELQALDKAAEKVTQQAAANYCDDALAKVDIGDVRADMLSWEQAQQMGLMKKDGPA